MNGLPILLMIISVFTLGATFGISLIFYHHRLDKSLLGGYNLMRFFWIFMPKSEIQVDESVKWLVLPGRLCLLICLITGGAAIFLLGK